MSKIPLLQGLLLNLKGEIQPGRREYLPQKEAYGSLKMHTGQDFGDDFEKWEQWIRENPTSTNAKGIPVDTSKTVSDFLSKKS
ncbi:MAG: hypothetical protein V4719_29085 [Planctomycetota bacterium]